VKIEGPYLAIKPDVQSVLHYSNAMQRTHGKRPMLFQESDELPFDRATLPILAHSQPEDDYDPFEETE